MKNVLLFLFLILGVSSCYEHKVINAESSIKVERGYILYNSIDDKFKYFIPFERQGYEALPPKFTLASFAEGFSFNSNNRLDQDLSGIPVDTIPNEIGNYTHSKYFNRYLVSPVIIIYEIDFVESKKSPSMYLLEIGEKSKSIKLKLLNISGDVLKIKRFNQSTELR